MRYFTLNSVKNSK